MRLFYVCSILCCMFFFAIFPAHAQQDNAALPIISRDKAPPQVSQNITPQDRAGEQESPSQKPLIFNPIQHILERDKEPPKGLKTKSWTNDEAPTNLEIKPLKQQEKIEIPPPEYTDETIMKEAVSKEEAQKYIAQQNNVAEDGEGVDKQTLDDNATPEEAVNEDSKKDKEPSPPSPEEQAKIKKQTYIKEYKAAVKAIPKTKEPPRLWSVE